MDMQAQPCFTIPNVWTGGYYELKLCLGSPSEANIQNAFTAIWHYPLVEGPYDSRDIEPSGRPPGSANLTDDHLFGIMQFKGTRIPCGTFIVREEDDAGTREADFFGFYIPMSALALVLPVGSYPLHSHDAAPEWRKEIDLWLLDMLRKQRSAFSFEVAAIGFEVDLSSRSAATLTLADVPTQRYDGLVFPGDDDIEWYPPTRFDIIRLI